VIEQCGEIERNCLTHNTQIDQWKKGWISLILSRSLLHTKTLFTDINLNNKHTFYVTNTYTHTHTHINTYTYTLSLSTYLSLLSLSLSHTRTNTHTHKSELVTEIKILFVTHLRKLLKRFYFSYFWKKIKLGKPNFSSDDKHIRLNFYLNIKMNVFFFNFSSPSSVHFYKVKRCTTTVYVNNLFWVEGHLVEFCCVKIVFTAYQEKRNFQRLLHQTTYGKLIESLHLQR
jgi:hypothetical protein